MRELPPVLTDGVVTLRGYRVEDIDEMVAMATDPEFARQTTVPVPYTRQHALERIATVRAGTAAGEGTYWVVEAPDPDSGAARFAGTVDVRSGPPPDVGYGLSAWARGSGYAHRAVALAARWAFDEAGHPVLHWSTNVGNLASWRVAHACGFTFHGERPLSLPQRGTLVDGWFASLRATDELTPRTTWWSVPELVGERVRMRPFTEADVPRIVEACSDPTSGWFLPGLPHPYTEADAHAFLHTKCLDTSLGKSINWAVTARDDDRLLANIGLFDLTSVMLPTGGEIGYWAHPDARGRGVVSEAVRLAVTHAFTKVEDGGLGRHRLQIGASWDNAASRGVAERAGFTLLGRWRQDGVVGRGSERRLDDGAWYELLRD